MAADLLVDVDLAREAVEVVEDHAALVLRVGERGVVGGVLVTAAHAQVVGLEDCRAEVGVVPVEVLAFTVHVGRVEPVVVVHSAPGGATGRAAVEVIFHVIAVADEGLDVQTIVAALALGQDGVTVLAEAVVHLPAGVAFAVVGVFAVTLLHVVEDLLEHLGVLLDGGGLVGGGAGPMPVQIALPAEFQLHARDLGVLGKVAVAGGGVQEPLIVPDRQWQMLRLLAQFLRLREMMARIGRGRTLYSAVSAADHKEKR